MPFQSHERTVKVKRYFSRISFHLKNKKVLGFSGLFLLALTLPLIIIFSQTIQTIRQNAAGNVSPLIFGTNLTLQDASDQFVTSQTTRNALSSIHVQLIRLPIRTPGAGPPEFVTALQDIKAMGVIPLVTLKYSQTDPTGAAKLVIQQVNSVFGNSLVYYEFGNERDLAGVNQTAYTNQWNQTIPQVKSLAPNGKFGGPANFAIIAPGVDNGPYVAYFVHNANPKPDYISWHEYSCGNSDSAQSCISKVHNWANHINEVKGLIQKNGDALPPIFITEWNYDANNPSGDPRATPQFQQQFTQTALQELANDGVTGATHYVATGHPLYNLVDPNGSLTPEGQMFGQMYTQLIGSGGGASPTPTTPATTVTTTTTPIPTPTSAQTVTPTPTNNPCTTPQPTDTNVPTGTPTQNPSVTPTPTLGPPTGSLFLHFEGIDNNNNLKPKHPQRNVILSFFKTNNFFSVPIATLNLVVTFVSGDVNGSFVNPSIDFSSIPQGTYYVLAKSPEGSLQELLNPSQIINISPGQNITLGSQNPINMRIGDLNNDNAIDIKDYNILVDCYGSKQNSPGCKGHKTSDTTKGNFADLNDDGIINGIDYNILIRHFGENGYGNVPNVSGNASGFVTDPCATPSPTQTPTNAINPTSPATSSSPIPTTPLTSGGYQVKGNTIVDSSGNPVIFRGVSRPSLEWSSTGINLSLTDYQKIQSWNAKIVRLPMNQRYWLNNTSGYQQTIDQNIQWIQSLGMNALLDLHWSDQGNSSVKPAQQCMADSNSVTFWQQVASKYKSNQHVFFELYNEPHSVSWSVWLNGGNACGFTVVGMQQLYNTVRATGATNLVFIGGLNYAFDLSGVPANRVQGNNIVYATHPYDYAGKNTPADWDKGFGFLTATDPVIMTEFGDYNCSTTLYTDVINYAESKKAGWIGWAWYPGGCRFPALINDWNGTPSATGQVVKSALLAH